VGLGGGWEWGGGHPDGEIRCHNGGREVKQSVGQACCFFREDLCTGHKCAAGVGRGEGGGGGG